MNVDHDAAVVLHHPARSSIDQRGPRTDSAIASRKVFHFAQVVDLSCGFDVCAAEVEELERFDREWIVGALVMEGTATPFVTDYCGSGFGRETECGVGGLVFRACQGKAAQQNCNAIALLLTRFMGNVPCEVNLRVARFCDVPQLPPGDAGSCHCDSSVLTAAARISCSLH